MESPGDSSLEYCSSESGVGSCPGEGPPSTVEPGAASHGGSCDMAIPSWSIALVVLGSFCLFVCLLAAVYYWCVLRYRSVSSNVSLKGKTVVITGGSAGIGKATALDLAQRGARLILACRNEEKTERVMGEIRAAVEGADVSYRHLDLARLQSVRDFAERFNREETCLDVLINNAGIGQEGRTEDGFDLSFGVNHLGPFLLTNLLLDLLRRSAPSRVVNLSSLAHKFVPSLDFSGGEVEGKGEGEGDPCSSMYPHLAGYPISKMAVNLFTHELARRMDGSGVAVCSVHPGIVYTGAIDGLLRRGGCCRRLLIPLFRLMMRDVKAGAQCVIHCAISESIPAQSGSYFVDCRPTSEGALASDEAVARRLWEASCNATGLKD